jgi:hypothetical protein
MVALDHVLHALLEPILLLGPLLALFVVLG